MSDQKAPTGTDRASYHAREPIEDDDERLAMRKGHMPPPAPERVANPRIREDRAVQSSVGIPTNLGKYAPCHLQRCPHTGMVWLRSVFPQCVRKTGPDVNLQKNVSTYQCNILFNNMVPSTGRVNFGKPRILISRFLQLKSSTLPTITSCHFLQNSGETTTRM